MSFDLAEGDYKFRADYMGYQFWSNVSNVPATLSDVLTIAHQDVTVTVERLYQTSEPLQGVRVYLFTGSGAYMGQYAETNVQGQVTFNLPEQSYKVRADYSEYQFWSDAFVWNDTAVTINHGLAVLHVTKDGLDVADAPVYLFKASGSYLGRYEYTDANGVAEFLLPDRQYKFRVDHEGTQYWSEVITIIPHEENNIEIDLDLLALDLTNDPKPVRYDGEPPEPEGVLVASIGFLTGILAQSVITQTSAKKVYYFINDHLGTPTKVVDENGSVVWSAEYKPFGGVDITVSDVENNFRFAGQYFDQETSLHYNYHRYYDPRLGRYLRADPIGIEGGINLFVYTLNNPLNFIDPKGLACGPGPLGDLIIPDTPGGYDFSECCQKHDDCYGKECDKTKTQCDDEFYNCMKRVCDYRHLSSRECYNMASRYWDAVDRFGEGSFEDAREEEPCKQCDD